MLITTRYWTAFCAAALIGIPQAIVAMPAPQAAEPQAAATTTAAQPVPEGGVPQWLRPETPAQRRARLGTYDDPGTDPDPSKHFFRFGQSYHIEKFERRFAEYDAPYGFVRPMAMVNVQKEIYQQNDKYVWVWVADVGVLKPEVAAPPDPNTPTKASPYHTYDPASIEFFTRIRPEFTPLIPPASGVTVRFEESSKGLPQSGSWRNAPAVADMNADGCPDLIAPPERGGNPSPSIYLGDCKGNWKVWSEVQWPHGLDYGAVVAADFNRDGNMDLAFSVHLNGVYVFLGDSKGHFTEVIEGLPRDFPTRRLRVADVDGDGYPDLVVVSEGPTAVFGVKSPGGNLRVLLNRKKGRAWEALAVAKPADAVGGDYLAVGDLNGDRKPDMLASSVYFNGRDILYLSDGARNWRLYPSDGADLPSMSYYFANTVGRFTSDKRADAVVSYIHYFPTDLDPEIVGRPELQHVVSVDLVRMHGKKVARVPLMRWDSTAPVSGMDAADMNGDGKTDVVFSRTSPRDVVLLLGDGRGGFTRANVEGISLQPNTNYDLQVADVNGDGRPDVIVMYESSSTTVLADRDGSIHVYLNLGPVAAAPARAAK